MNSTVPTTNATTPKFSADKLVEALQAAAKAAEDAAQCEDGGTCNFDTAVLRLPGVRETKVQEAAQRAGVRLEKIEFLGRPGYFVFVGFAGQANRRTRQAEATAKALKSHGFRVAMWYHAD